MLFLHTTVEFPALPVVSGVGRLQDGWRRTGGKVETAGGMSGTAGRGRQGYAAGAALMQAIICFFITTMKSPAQKLLSIELNSSLDGLEAKF